MYVQLYVYFVCMGVCVFGFFWLWSIRPLSHPMFIPVPRKYFWAYRSFGLGQLFFVRLRSAFLLTILSQFAHSSFGTLGFVHLFFCITINCCFAYYFIASCTFFFWRFIFLILDSDVFYACVVFDIAWRFCCMLREDNHEKIKCLEIS